MEELMRKRYRSLIAIVATGVVFYFAFPGTDWSKGSTITKAIIKFRSANRTISLDNYSFEVNGRSYTGLFTDEFMKHAIGEQVYIRYLNDDPKQNEVMRDSLEDWK